MESGIPVLIDGPNFINRIIDLGIDKDLIAAQLTLRGFIDKLNALIEQNDIDGSCEPIEFICSKKLFGSGSSRFTQSERDLMIHRFMKEKGVYITEVILPGSSEKGVDSTIIGKIETFSEKHKTIILVSGDRDYVPTCNKMRTKGIRIILVDIGNKCPIELCNEGYLTIEMDNFYRDFFNYSYPTFNMDEDFTIEKFRIMMSNADDRKDNQLRVDNDGTVSYSHIHIGGQNTDFVRFHYETLMRYNEYVGPLSASDGEYVKREFEDVVHGWKYGAKGYYDYPTKSVFRA